MASVQITTTTNDRGLFCTEDIVAAGSRLWAAFADGAIAVVVYSDDNGASWTSITAFTAGSSAVSCHVWNNAGTWWLIAVASAGQGGTTAALQVKTITSGVDSGTPGAFSAATSIDVGGTNLGVAGHAACVAATATNPRMWIVARKTTASGIHEIRGWYCPLASVLTAGSWVSTNFTNLGSQSGSNVTKFGKPVWWTVGGADKLTVLCHKVQGLTSQTYNSFTFDPTATTPTPGTATALTMLDTTTFVAGNTEGHAFDVAAKAGYLVFGTIRNSGASPTQWDFFKTVDGTTWSNPTGWTAITAGRATIAGDGTDFHLVHNATYGASASTASAYTWRKISTAGDGMAAGTAFSDTSGCQAFSGVGGGYLVVIYRAGTASPYPVRADRVSLAATGAAADSAPATDTAGRAVQLARAAADTAPAADTVGRQMSGNRSVADSAPAADAAARSPLARGRTVADSAPASDAAAGVRALPRSVADGAPAVDTAVRAAARARAAGDGAPAADSCAASVSHRLAASALDSAPAADAAARGAAGAARGAPDSAPGSDLAGRRLQVGRLTSDLAVVIDEAGRTYWAGRLAVDAATAGDGVEVVYTPRPRVTHPRYAGTAAYVPAGRTYPHDEGVTVYG